MANIVTKTLWIFGLSVLLFIIIFAGVPWMWKQIAKTAILSSPDVIIKDIAGLITISGAAPQSITIYYETQSEKYNYNLEITGRNLILEMMNAEDISKQVKQRVSDEIPIDPETSIKESNTFTIQKIRDNGENVYEVYP